MTVIARSRETMALSKSSMTNQVGFVWRDADIVASRIQRDRMHAFDRKRMRDALQGRQKAPVRRAREGARAVKRAVLLLPDQIKRDKGVWWMPWQQEAMKDVIPCDKPWGAGNRL